MSDPNTQQGPSQEELDAKAAARQEESRGYALMGEVTREAAPAEYRAEQKQFQPQTPDYLGQKAEFDAAAADYRARVEATATGLGEKAGEAVPMPEAAAPTREQIVAWFKANREDFRTALAEAYGFDQDSKKMTDVELSDLMLAIQNSDKPSIDFVLENWFKRIKGLDQKAEVDEDKVVANILSRIAENRPPERLAA